MSKNLEIKVKRGIKVFNEVKIEQLTSTVEHMEELSELLIQVVEDVPLLAFCLQWS